MREAIIEFHQLDREPDGMEQMLRMLEDSGMQIDSSHAQPGQRIGLIRARRAA